MINLYTEIMVWKRLDDKSAVRYFCLGNVKTKKYAVQNADFFRLPFKELQFRASERQLIELFIEISPLERCNWFDTIEEAISAHDQDFA